MAPGSRRSPRCRPLPVDRAAVVERLRLTVLSARPGAARACRRRWSLAILIDPRGAAGAGAGRLPARLGWSVPADRAADRAAPPGQRRAARRARSPPATPTPTGSTGSPGRSSGSATRRAGGTSRSCWFSATGGFVLSALPALLLAAPVVHLIGAFLDGGLVLVAARCCLAGPMLVAWWLVTPPLVRARALAERGILGHSRVERLEQRVEQVAASRAETLDHYAAEVRRIERDLHDGAQARIAARHERRPGREAGRHRSRRRGRAAAGGPRDDAVSALEDLRTARPRDPPAGPRRPRPGRRRSRRWPSRSRCR